MDNVPRVQTFGSSVFVGPAVVERFARSRSRSRDSVCSAQTQDSSHGVQATSDPYEVVDSDSSGNTLPYRDQSPQRVYMDITCVLCGRTVVQQWPATQRYTGYRGMRGGALCRLCRLFDRICRLVEDWPIQGAFADLLVVLLENVVEVVLGLNSIRQRMSRWAMEESE